MGTLRDGIEPVAGVCGRLPAQTADGLQVLQAEQRELLSVLPASHRLVLAPVFSEGLAGPLQYRVHHYLVHGASAPAQRAVVGLTAALCLPALQQAGFTEPVFASDHYWLAEDKSTNWTGEVVLQPCASAGHSLSPGGPSDDRQAAKVPPGPVEGNLILTLE